MFTKRLLAMGFILCFCNGGRTSLLAQNVADSNPKWRFGLGYRAMFNVDVSFKNAGASQSANNPSVGGRSYEDGFVGTDSTGNALDLTTYWGYERNEQYVGDSILLRNSQAGSLSQEESPWNNGFELTLGREFGARRHFRWGLESAFNYSHIESSMFGVAPSGVLSLDAFLLNGIIPPIAPYSGPQVSGPGVPLLGASPTVTPLSIAANIDANIYGFRFGPYLEFPLFKRLSIAFGAGLSLAIVNSHVSFQEIAPAPYATLVRSASGDDVDMVVGGYVTSQLVFNLVKQWDAFSGVQLHMLSDYDYNIDGKISSLDFGPAITLMLGVQYRF